LLINTSSTGQQTILRSEYLRMPKAICKLVILTAYTLLVSKQACPMRILLTPPLVPSPGPPALIPPSESQGSHSEPAASTGMLLLNVALLSLSLVRSLPPSLLLLPSFE
jgi:hypothetical protein